MSKLTSWFDGSKFQPGQPGLYEVNHHILGWLYSYWDETFWYTACFTRSQAIRCFEDRNRSRDQDRDFRGLTYDSTNLHALRTES